MVVGVAIRLARSPKDAQLDRKIEKIRT
jgi:hypothetical protein